MDDSINSYDYTASELREWLRHLGMTTQGSKAVLMARLNGLSVEERGTCPTEEGEETDDEETVEGQQHQEANEGTTNDQQQKLQNSESQQQILTKEKDLAENEMQQILQANEEQQMIASSEINQQKLETSGKQQKLPTNDMQHKREVANMDNLNKETEFMKRELELLRREKDVLAKENELLRRAAQLDKSLVQLGENNGAMSDEQNIPFNVLKEFLPECDGEGNFDVWVTQLKGIKEMYKVDDNKMRALMITKLKGKAQTWLQSKPGYMCEDIASLIKQMESLFSTKENKIILRRKFEARKWKHGEKFVEYFNDKIILSNAMLIDDDELIDYIIEGIPDIQLRTHANMRNYGNKTELLQAFSKIELSQRFEQRAKVQNTAANVGSNIEKSQLRCFNCNCVGHFASECRKPKREAGTCYACGSFDHRAVDCQLNKKKSIQLVENNDYVRYFKFSLNSDKNFILFLECLIDSGSPISFIKKKYISNKFKINQDSNVKYYGINKSELKTFGKISCVMELSSNIIHLELFVVNDESMSYSVILGRDFLKAANVKMSCEVDMEKCLKEININDNVEIIEKAYKTVSVNSLKDENDDFIKQILSIDYEVEKYKNYSIGKEISYCNSQIFHDLFCKHYLTPQRPYEPMVKTEMKLVVDNPKPFNYPPRRLSYREKNQLQKILDEFLDKKIIRPSESEFASPIVLVPKKSGELRMCVDYRTLNKITAKDNYPIPLIDDLLDRLANKKIFSKLDLKNGFFHVYMHQESIKYTSFITPLGQYEFLRMPFGLKNAPSISQRFINKIFSDMVREGKLIIYLDDIMIATENIYQHFQVIIEVFKRLVENKLELRLDKCEFLQTSVNI